MAQIEERLKLGAKNEMEAWVARILADTELELVEVTIRRSGPRQHFRIDIDRAGPIGVTLDQCKQVSEALGDALEEADAIPSSYVLEVSSPGADRPIRTEQDIRRNTGRRVTVLARDENRKEQTLRGTLEGLQDGKMVLTADDGSSQRVAMDCIVKAHQELEL